MSTSCPPGPDSCWRHAAGAAGGLHQLPAQPGLPADLPAGGQRGGGHAPVPWHPARPDLHCSRPTRQFMGAACCIDASPGQRAPQRVRHGIGLAVLGRRPTGSGPMCRAGRATVQVAFCPSGAACTACPPLTAETRFPAGHLPGLDRLAPGGPGAGLPRARARPPPLPPGEPRAGGAAQAARPPRANSTACAPTAAATRSSWWSGKRLAPRPRELVSRDTQQAQRHELWLDLAHTGAGFAGAPSTERGCRACAPGCCRPTAGLDYGLRLPAQIPPGQRRGAQAPLPGGAGAVLKRRRHAGTTCARCRRDARDTLFLLLVIAWVLRRRWPTCRCGAAAGGGGAGLARLAGLDVGGPCRGAGGCWGCWC
jgi:hypothetical protein